MPMPQVRVHTAQIHKHTMLLPIFMVLHKCVQFSRCCFTMFSYCGCASFVLKERKCLFCKFQRCWPLQSVLRLTVAFATS